MYFISYDPLKESLRERTLTDREALPYFVLFCALIALTPFTPSIQVDNLLHTVGGLARIAIAILGLLYCYKQNGGSSGHDFILKSIVLGWVVAVRCFLVFTLAFIAISFCATLFGKGAFMPTWLDFLVVKAFQIIYFQRLGRHLRDTRKYHGKPRLPARC